MKKFCAILATSLLPALLSAQGGVAVHVHKSSTRIFEPTEQPQIALTLNADQPAKGEIKIVVESDFGQNWCSYTHPYDLQAGDSLPVSLSLSLNPGFYRVAVSDGEQTADTFHLGYAPEKISSPIDRAANFETFWATARQELDAVAPRYRLHLLKEHSTAARRIYRVEMRSLGGETIRGYYAEPVAAGKYPAVVTFMGYNSEPWCPDADGAPERIEFILSHRGQGLNKPDNRYGDWIVSGIDSPEHYYYRGAYMDAVRAIDFVASRAKTDPALIFAEGGSQGGALTLAACALDHRIAAAAPYVPFMSDFADYLKLVSWPGDVLRQAAQAQAIREEELLRTLSYFDIKNLAPQVVCPILMGFGLEDGVCPPHTNFAGYNLITSPKSRIAFARRGHDVHNEKSWHAAREAFFAAQIQRIKTKINQ